MGQPTPRKHHYIPQFYLKGFVSKSTTNDTIWVLDEEEGRQWQEGIKAAARRTDFYKVELTDGSDPASLERVLAEAEGMLAPALQRTIETEKLPGGRDLHLLLNLVALMALRVPAMRTLQTRTAEALARKVSRDMVATKNGWEERVSKMKAEGLDVPDVPYEEMKRFVESGDYTLTVDIGSNWFAETILVASQRMLYYLLRRHWYLAVAAADAPDLICSDNPVSLSATDMSPPPDRLGFAVPGTLLLFPLNRRMALVGSFEGMMLPSPAAAGTVALINGATGRSAERFLFTPDTDFVWLNGQDEICHTSDLLSLIRHR